MTAAPVTSQRVWVDEPDHGATQAVYLGASGLGDHVVEVPRRSHGRDVRRVPVDWLHLHVCGVERHFHLRIELHDQGRSTVRCTVCGHVLASNVLDVEAREVVATAICGYGAPVPGDAHLCAEGVPA